MKMVEGIMKSECDKIGTRVGELASKTRKEREEMRRWWEEKKVATGKRIAELEKKVASLENDRQEGRNNGKEAREVENEEGGEWGKGVEERRISKLEVKMDKRERETRWKNIVIKGVKLGEGEDYEQEVEKIWGSRGYGKNEKSKRCR